MVQEFYITLPSNVPTDFEYNTISSYNTRLHQRLLFPQNEKWSIGLSEILYTKTWNNVVNNHQIKLFNQNGDFISSNEPYTAVAITRDINIIDNNEYFINDVMIKCGYYDSIQDLCSYINKKFEAFDRMCKPIPSISYDKISNKVTLKGGIVNGIQCFPYLGKEIENILGLVDQKNLSTYDKAIATVESEYSSIKFKRYVPELEEIFNSEKIEGMRSCELNAGSHSLFVYCDIIEHNFVGDSFARLLRLVEVPNKSEYGDTIVLRYDQPHYIPLQTNTIDTIKVDVKDDTGVNIPFNIGRVIIKLIFKKYD